MAAVPSRDYAGAAILFSVAAVAASYIVLSPFEPFLSGSRRTEALFRDFTLIGSAGVSAALSCRLLRPLAGRLARHQYFLCPLTMGCLVVGGAHLLLGIVSGAVFTLWRFLGPSGKVALGDFGIEVEQFFFSVLLLSLGSFFAWFVTFPAGVLAAYCVEVFGWLREDARNRQQ